MIVDVIDALSSKNRTVKGWEGKVSLCDLGYCSAGLDEGWEGCGEGVNGECEEQHRRRSLAYTADASHTPQTPRIRRLAYTAEALVQT